ncbi:MAG: hypothetical protein MJZ74_00365 [Muribaculaceae bacterium]|nr:hypothetical protein [Muribaculaceae bacterium]
MKKNLIYCLLCFFVVMAVSSCDNGPRSRSRKAISPSEAVNYGPSAQEAERADEMMRASEAARNQAARNANAESEARSKKTLQAIESARQSESVQSRSEGIFGGGDDPYDNDNRGGWGDDDDTYNRGGSDPLF